MRDRYLKQLKVVQDDLLRMGSRVEHGLADAMQALSTWDVDLAQRVIAADHVIDTVRTSIEDEVIQIIATQAPVATDLRTLNATVAIAGELERAGDYAKGIAKRVGRCLKAPAILPIPPGLNRLGTMAQSMLNTSLNAFVQLDVTMARSLSIEDEQVDALEDEVIAELLDVARQDATKLECVINLMDVAHTLERLADRTTNIAERIIFIATNTTEELNA
jgi:phosphate transport system protein